jgi:preprotein translocase subunit Sec61beta
MGSMMKSMTIGPKFILSISMAAFVAIAIGGCGRLVSTRRRQDGHHVGAGVLKY